MSTIPDGANDRSFIPAIEQGMREALACGGPNGEPIEGVDVTLTDESMHCQDSSDQAFAAAGRLALQQSLQQPLPDLGVECLEP